MRRRKTPHFSWTRLGLFPALVSKLQCVLHVAFAILQRSQATASQPSFSPAHGLMVSLRIAAGNDLEAFHAAALLLARLLDASTENGTGSASLGRALTTWSEKHDVAAPTPDDALGLLVQSIASS